MSTLALSAATANHAARRALEPHTVVLFALSFLLHLMVWRWLAQLPPPVVQPGTPPTAVEVQLLAPATRATPPAQQADRPSKAPPPKAMNDATATTPSKSVRPKPKVERSAKRPSEPARDKTTATPPAQPLSAPMAPAATPATDTAAAPLIKAKHDPAFLHNPKPKYPPIANRRNWEGKVVLRVEVTAQGTSAAVAVTHSSGYDVLDESALEAVKAWRFVPAKRGDTPVPDTVLITINFHKDDDA